jgi:hypothetical protein
VATGAIEPDVHPVRVLVYRTGVLRQEPWDRVLRALGFAPGVEGRVRVGPDPVRP